MDNSQTTPIRFSDRDAISTGFDDLDDVLAGGWLPGQLIVVGGHYGSGNSDIAFDFAMAAARTGLPAAIFGLFLTAEEIGQRLVAAATSIPLERLGTEKLADSEADLVRRATAQQQTLPLFVEKDRVATVEELLDALRAGCTHRHLRFVVIDSFRLLLARNAAADQDDGEEIGRSLKALARELRVAIMLVVDLDRDRERPDKRPLLGDLSDVSKLDWFADTVLFVDRPDSHPKSIRPEIADVVVAKSHYGQPWPIYLVYQPDVRRFDSLPRRRPAVKREEGEC